MKWHRVSYRASEDLIVPGVSGLYAVYLVQDLFGLPVSIEPIYVGATSNLRRRFREHLADDEPNELLRDVTDEPGDALFWYEVLPLHRARQLEPELIRGLQPRTNRRYKAAQPRAS